MPALDEKTRPKRIKGNPPFGPDFDGYLVGSTTHAAGLDLQNGRGVPKGLLKDLQPGALGPGFGNVEGIVEDALGRAPFALHHQLVDKA